MSNRAPGQSGSRKISFNVSEQYDIQDVVGEGAYGVVWYVFLVFFTALTSCFPTSDNPAIWGWKGVLLRIFPTGNETMMWNSY
jgi:hypothetical protein